MCVSISRICLPLAVRKKRDEWVWVEGVRSRYFWGKKEGSTKYCPKVECQIGKNR